MQIEDKATIRAWWGTSLAVQWLRLCASNAGGAGSIPGRGTKMIPHATWRDPKKKKKKKSMVKVRKESKTTPMFLAWTKSVNYEITYQVQEYRNRASLVAQWLRICLLMQGTRVRALVWEDPTCRRATRPVGHNYWGCASGVCAPQQERSRQWKARAPQWRVASAWHN